VTHEQHKQEILDLVYENGMMYQAEIIKHFNNIASDGYVFGLLSELESNGLIRSSKTLYKRFYEPTRKEKPQIYIPKDSTHFVLPNWATTPQSIAVATITLVCIFGLCLFSSPMPHTVMVSLGLHPVTEVPVVYVGISDIFFWFLFGFWSSVVIFNFEKIKEEMKEAIYG